MRLRGRSLAARLNELIEAQVNDDTPRGDVIAAMGRAAGIDAGTVNQILNGEINCPPLERLEGFAEALGASVESLVSAAERDGCEYSSDDEDRSADAACVSCGGTDMSNAKTMRERAWTIVQNARSAWDAACQNGGPNDEARQALDRALEDAARIEQDAARIEKLNGIEDRFNEPAWRPTNQGASQRTTTGPDGTTDLNVFAEDLRSHIAQYAATGRDQARHVRVSSSPAYRSAFEAYLTRGRADMTPDEARALSEGTDTEGGFLVPVDMDMRILFDPREPAVVRALADVSTTTRDVVKRPTHDRVTLSWGSEASAVPEADTDFGEVEVHIGKLNAITKVSMELLEDAAVNVPSLLSRVYADAAAFAEDTAHLTGDGVNKPTGILFGNRVTRKNTATNDTFAADDIIELHYEVPARYRRNGSYLMESAIEKAVRKFKGSDNNYLWQPGLAADRPPTLMGRPLFNPDGIMDSTVADAKEIVVFGDVRSGYWIVDRVGTSIQRLDELYAGNDQVGFKIRRRTGGNVAIAAALRVLKVA